MDMVANNKSATQILKKLAIYGAVGLSSWFDFKPSPDRIGIQSAYAKSSQIHQIPLPELSNKRVFVAIINGDKEERHLDNVSNAISALTSRGVKKEDVFVCGKFTDEENSSVNRSPATKEKIREMFFAINNRINLEDTLVVYVTGHGIEDGIILENEKMSHLEFIEQIKNLRSHLVFVADSCFSGSIPDRIIAAGLDSVSMSPGVIGKETKCHFFANPFWNAVRDGMDIDGDRISTLEEIFHYSMESYKRSGKEVSYGTFRRSISELSDIQQLQNGNVLLEISTSWCQVCKNMAQDLDKFDMLTGGGIKTYSIDWEKNPLVSQVKDFLKTSSHIQAYPTLLFIKNGKVKTVHEGRIALPELIKNASLYYGIKHNKDKMINNDLKDLALNEEEKTIAAMKKIGPLISSEKEFLGFYDYLVRALASDKPDVVRAAQDSIVEMLVGSQLIENPITFPLQRYLLRYGSLESRKKLCIKLHNLGKLSHHQATILIDSLSDPDEIVRFFAANAIVNHAPKSVDLSDVISILAGLLNEKKYSYSAVTGLRKAISCDADISVAMPALARLLEDISPLDIYTFHVVQGIFVDSLINGRNASFAFNTLKGLLIDDNPHSDERIMYIFDQALLFNPGLGYFFANALSDENQKVRSCFSFYLNKATRRGINITPVISALTKSLLDSEKEVRKNSAEALESAISMCETITDYNILKLKLDEGLVELQKRGLAGEVAVYQVNKLMEKKRSEIKFYEWLKRRDKSSIKFQKKFCIKRSFPSPKFHKPMVITLSERIERAILQKDIRDSSK